MSQILSDVTLTLNTASKIDLSGYPASNIGWIVFINASPYACRAMVGSQVIPMPAWYYYPIFVNGRLTGGLSVTPYLQTIPGVGFTKTLSTILYELHELPDNQSPQPLGGGPVDLTVASSINQTGQPAGNSVIFAEPVNDTSVTGAVSLNNQGQLVLGDATYKGSIALLGNTLAQMSLSLTGFIRLFDAAAGNQRVDIEPGVFTLADASLNNAVVINSDGSPVIDISAATGAVGLKLKVGTLTRWNVFTGSANNAGTLQAHGLGVKPDFAAFQETGTAGDTNTFSWDIAASDATNVKVWTANATLRTYIALAIKL